jgi:hypothetical protein
MNGIALVELRCAAVEEGAEIAALLIRSGPAECAGIHAPERRPPP